MTDPFFFPNQKSSSSVNINIEDCREFLRRHRESGQLFDAVVTDPPYEIALHGKAWDSTGIVFDTTFWSDVFAVMKPGSFLFAFTANRLYHRVAVAVEDAGFKMYPFMQWQFPAGLQKPVNVSELFDRDNIPDRKPTGTKKGSGFTSANAKHGAQQRLTKEFNVYERGVSPEGKQWLGHYYGVNCFKPVSEPIIVAQKPISHSRAIDNIREYGTGSLNLGALNERYGGWPTTILHHKKAKQSDHESNHPSVKPVDLMRDLCAVACPPGGRILDMFGGTGTTAQAAVLEGFDCTIVEMNPEMQSVIERRLESTGATVTTNASGAA